MESEKMREETIDYVIVNVGGAAEEIINLLDGHLKEQRAIEKMDLEDQT